MKNHQHIGITAHYTALTWARLGLPEAERFVTARGRLLRAAVWPLSTAARRLLGGDFQTLILEPRSRVIEARVEAARESGCRSFLELAAGLSPRGVAHSRDPAVTWVEVDLPGMNAAKRALVGLDHGPGHHLLAGDALDPATFARAAPLFEAAPPVTVLVEGLFPYLARPDASALLELIAAFLVRMGGGSLLFDTTPSSDIERARGFGPLAARLIEVLVRGRLGLAIEDDADGATLIRRAGFTDARIHRPRARSAGPGRGSPPTPVVLYEARVEP